MAFREYILANGKNVTIYKRKGNRNLKLSITTLGEIRVSIPLWAPYKAGLQFAHSRIEWIDQQKIKNPILEHGKSVGRAHRLVFEAAESKSVTSRIVGNNIYVRYPFDLNSSSPVVQAKANQASVRALRLQARQLLPQRLSNLAARHGFDYADITIKQLKGRWGSCDQHKHIVLNLFLMQLPWELIDYVILHELTHTRILKHGPSFWAEMQEVLPQTKVLRQQLKNYQPIVRG